MCKKRHHTKRGSTLTGESRSQTAKSRLTHRNFCKTSKSAIHTQQHIVTLTTLFPTPVVSMGDYMSGASPALKNSALSPIGSEKSPIPRSGALAVRRRTILSVNLATLCDTLSCSLLYRTPLISSSASAALSFL